MKLDEKPNRKNRKQDVRDGLFERFRHQRYRGTQAPNRYRIANGGDLHQRTLKSRGLAHSKKQKRVIPTSPHTEERNEGSSPKKGEATLTRQGGLKKAAVRKET